MLISLVVLAVVIAWAIEAFQSDLMRVRDAVHRGSVMAITEVGPIEYAEKGAGRPILLIHGAGGGFDQGLLIAGDLIGEGFHIIAPSRFGYLRTPIPEDSSPASQADAHAALLDQLHIGKAIIVGVSAGARSAVELAIRHPDKVEGLLLVVPGTYSPKSPVSITAGRGNEFAFWAVNHGGDFAWWVTEKIAPSILVRFVGIRPELVSSAPDSVKRRVAAIVEGIEPLSLRFRGINIDSMANLHELPLQNIHAPTLAIGARDDLFNTLPAAEYLASKIPGAKLVKYGSGGHLLLGHEQDVRMEIRRFVTTAVPNTGPSFLSVRTVTRGSAHP